MERLAILDPLRSLPFLRRLAASRLESSLAAKAQHLAAENHELVEENRRLSERLDGRGGFASFVGESAAARGVRELGLRAPRARPAAE